MLCLNYFQINFNSYFNFIIVNNFLCKCDTPQKFQFGFQDPATQTVEWLLKLHDIIMIDLWIIIGIILYILYIILSYNKENQRKKLRKPMKLLGVSPKIKHELQKILGPVKSNKSFSHCEYLEIFWTVMPALILLGIALPTFNLLYALDDKASNATVHLRVFGHQWYWTYFITYHNYNDFSLEYDSYILTADQLELGQIRLLEVDNTIILPTKQHINLSITSTDVLHSWAIPSFGIKIDACPGRVTKGSLLIKRPGIFFGQCSEICGVNHGFMPIVVNSRDRKSVV